MEFAGGNGGTRERERRDPFSGKGLPSALVPRSRGTIHTTLPKALETKKERYIPQSFCRLSGETTPDSKVFAPLFSKSGTFSYRRFSFCLAFSFAPFSPKEKAAEEFAGGNGERGNGRRRGTFREKSPSFSFSALARKTSLPPLKSF